MFRTVYYLLTQAGLKNVPRDSAGMYVWVWKESTFHAVVSTKDDTFELEKLRPGDLLFWTGTYQIDRDPPVTHVMIYLGINRQTGRRTMLGASDGRTFNGKLRYGVSVFDFKLPRRAGNPTLRRRRRRRRRPRPVSSATARCRASQRRLAPDFAPTPGMIHRPALSAVHFGPRVRDKIPVPGSVRHDHFRSHSIASRSHRM